MVAAGGIAMRWLDLTLVEEGSCWPPVLACLSPSIRGTWDTGEPPTLRAAWWWCAQLASWRSQWPWAEHSVQTHPEGTWQYQNNLCWGLLQAWRNQATGGQRGKANVRLCAAGSGTGWWLQPRIHHVLPAASPSAGTEWPASHCPCPTRR